MHGATHATDGFLDDSQTDTCPLVLLLGMETLKYLENLLRVAWVDAKAIVAHVQLAIVLSYRTPAEFDTFAWGTVEFCGVADEVLEDLAQQDGLDLHGRPCSLPEDVDIFWQAERSDDLLQDRVEVDCLIYQIAAADV